MDISTTHADAVAAAIRLPALNARLALLVEDTARAKVEFYSDPAPTVPGDAPTGDLVVTVNLTATAGVVNGDPDWNLELDTPVEATITGADPSTGTAVTWARIYDGTGAWWADVSVSEVGLGGEIEIAETTLYNGATCRLVSGVVSG
jgi:hypothetical protein